MLMSSKEFFVERYKKLGWEYRETQLKPSIRINKMNVAELDVIKRLQSQGTELEKIPFL